jgi:hypothetical protein
MPSKSAAQHRLMEAAAHGRSNKVPKGVAREFLKADSRGEDTQLHKDDMAPGGTDEGVHSKPTGKQPAARGTVNEQTHGEQQNARRGLKEGPPAGTPTISAGAPMKRTGTNQAHRPPSPPDSYKGDEINVPAGKAIEKAIDAGAREFNDQVKHRSKMIRDGRKRSLERHR